MKANPAQFGQNSSSKQAAPSAEFRIIDHSDLADFFESVEYKKVMRKKRKFLWYVKEKIVVDNYKEALNTKTRLISALNERAFLLFNDLVGYLNSKGIKVENKLPEHVQEKFEQREEYPILIDSESAVKLLDQLNKLEVRDKDLLKVDIDNLHKLDDTLFDKMRLEIKTFMEALFEVSPYTVLFIRVID